MSQVRKNGFGNNAGEKRAIDSFEGTKISFSPHKFVTRQNIIPVADNELVFSLELLSTIDPNSKYFLTSAFWHVPSNFIPEEMLILGYAFNSQDDFFDAMVVVDDPKNKKFFSNENSIGPIPVRGAEVVHGKVVRMNREQITRILEAQGETLP